MPYYTSVPKSAIGVSSKILEITRSPGKKAAILNDDHTAGEAKEGLLSRPENAL
ncbi:hypothetical protein ACH35V_32525 [Actinomadura sp. 1N219]|uniref:hypothetical protein n=1 Tax=Actinomadura sp. 1N219 TaxID=3375152 RepID=UPI0037A043B8